jgi:glycolate oxidase iron-sulfur subunit
MSTQLPAGPAAELKSEESGLLACVHCGFCLNACPTYRRVGNHGDSPRGRLDLMHAVLEGRIEPDDEAFQLHIDRCLGCRACEPVCPSGVPYGFLLERARNAIANTAGVSLQTKLLITAYTSPIRPVFTFFSRVVRNLGLAALMARLLPPSFAKLRFANAMLAASAPARQIRDGRRAATGSLRPQQSAADGPGGTGEDVGTDPTRAFADPHALLGAYPRATAAPVHPRTDTKPMRVAMLTGCVQQSLFARVNDATARVLKVHECEVVAVPGQVCCGALDAHAGRLDRARELARANIAAFEAAGVDAVIVNAAGCGAMLKEYGEQLHHDEAWAARAKSFAKKVRDVSEFLVERGVRRGAPVTAKVTFDAPCHLHHGQRIREAPLRVLDAIPGLERIPLRDYDECCGGAGLYGVQHPELGGRILSDKIDAIRETGADLVLTPNPGCMMQIGAGLLLHGDQARVAHPMELLDESYRRAAEALDR